MNRRSAGAAAFISVAVIVICSVILIKNSPNNNGNKPDSTDTEKMTFNTGTVTENSDTASVTTSHETEKNPVDTAQNGKYEYYTDVSAYLQYIDTRDEAYLVLANRSNPIGKDYIPTDLKPILQGYSMVMKDCAAKAFEAMYKEMKALNMWDAGISNTYRSYETQYKLYYERYIPQEKRDHPDYTDEQIMALVDTYSARPGTSDHQTGLAVDFSPVSSKFEETKAYDFLIENAYKFGFILRFPKGKTDITGYMFESWHWRFVGREAATFIYENGITLEEYVAMNQ